jgi:hypothetical protein
VAGHATSSFPIKVDDALSRKVAFCVEQRMTEPVLEHIKVRFGPFFATQLISGYVWFLTSFCR